MSNKDWQIGPVLKDKLGSQGTLFRGGTKYSSPNRFPKGYTPERQAEVADAVVRPSTTVSLTKGVTETRGVASNNFGDRKVRTSGDMSAPMEWQSNQATRNMVDTIARSTVPVEHLSGTQFRLGSPAQLGPKVAGHFDKGGDALTKPGEAVIRVAPEHTQGSTVIHEIGHNVSHQHEGNSFPRDADKFSGQEEAFADDYAEQHFRDRKARPVRQETYGGGPWAGNIQRSDEFWRSYHQNRVGAMAKAEFDADNARYYNKYPEEQQHPDGSMDVPLIHKDYAARGEEKTTPQNMIINDEALPEWHEKYRW